MEERVIRGHRASLYQQVCDLEELLEKDWQCIQQHMEHHLALNQQLEGLKARIWADIATGQVHIDRPTE